MATGPAKPTKRFKLWWLLLIPAILIVVLFGLILASSGIGVDATNPPKFMQTDFIDLSRIYSISKFRSLAGHDFSGGGETCRSMKHYFSPQRDMESELYMQQHQGIPKPPDGKTDIPIYSPVDGTIVDISEEHTPIGKQIRIIPDKAPAFAIRLFHVWLSSDFHAGFPLFGWGGSHVKAGEKLGVIGGHQGTDIAVQIGNMPWNENYVSYFDVMPDTIFAAYKARGITARNDLVLTKEYRDAHAVACQKEDEQRFDYPAGYDSEQEDYVHLSGYVKPVYGNYQNGGGQQQSH